MAIENWDGIKAKSLIAAAILSVSGYVSARNVIYIATPMEIDNTVGSPVLKDKVGGGGDDKLNWYRVVVSKNGEKDFSDEFIGFIDNAKNKIEKGKEKANAKLYANKVAADAAALAANAPKVSAAQAEYAEKKVKEANAAEVKAADEFDKIDANIPRYHGGEPALILLTDKDRVMQTKGDRLYVIYMYRTAGADCSANDSINFEETQRKTALDYDFGKLVRAVFANNANIQLFGMERAASVTLCVVSKDYYLQRTRSTLNITISGAKPSSQVVITGPVEHFFLSGDIVTKGAHELKYNESSKTLVTRDTPSQAYLGINYMIGDLYEQNVPIISKDRIVAKVMLDVSKRPWDNFGVGIGYRFHGIDFTKDNKELGGFMLFAGHFWARGDKLNDDGSVESGQGSYKGSWRLGVSYAFDAAMKWFE